MADSGSYRLRRYGVFEINQASLQLTYQSNSTFYQSLETNPLNGGINRKFSELLKSTIENHFLHALMRLDFKSLPSSITCKNISWRIGVHQIKITSYPGCPGNPTPEGIHRDDEAFTVQHLIRRHNIAFGENLFYGESKMPSLDAKIRLLQKDFFDSYYFDKSVWHSVSPVESLDGINEGYRDVLLLDFVPIREGILLWVCLKKIILKMIDKFFIYIKNFPEKEKTHQWQHIHNSINKTSSH